MFEMSSSESSDPQTQEKLFMKEAAVNFMRRNVKLALSFLLSHWTKV